MKPTQGYADVHGLKMYYEIEGHGDPLVYLPPAFGHCGLKSFPELAKNYSVITVDFQGHGRTADIPDRPLSLEQNAQDVVALLKHLGVSKADFFGESYGGAVATILALSHPDLVGRVATFGATFGHPQVALNLEMFVMSKAPDANSPAFQVQRESYLKLAPDPTYWPLFWEKVCRITWNGFTEQELRGLQAPLLIALGDHDLVRLEHAIETFRMIPNAQLAVIPDAGHFALYSEPHKVIPFVQNFLNPPSKKIAIATAGTGYQPGLTK